MPRMNVSHRLVLGALLVPLTVTHAPEAAASMELARARNCMACHAVERKLIGPSFKEIAARYASGGDAAVKLMASKIVNGGAGAWGAVPMPANPKVTADEAQKLAQWVLATK
jgi:cytochrome c